MKEILAGPLGLYQRIKDEKNGAYDSFIRFSIYTDNSVIKSS